MFHRNLDAVIRSPTSAEVEQAKKNVQYGIDTLNQIERELKETRARLANLEQRQDAVQRDLDLNRSIASNLRSIPDEIFSLIFEYYVESDTWASPWVLMGVCRQWRAAAIQARRIWSKISVTHAIHTSQRPHERTRLGYEICHTVPLLERALDRAAGAPLHLCFNFGHSPHSNVYGDKDMISRQLLKVLQETKAYLRIYELETKSTSTDWIKNVEFDGFEFPALEKAWLTTSSKSLNERIKKTSSRLRWLNLGISSGDALDWDLSGMPRLSDLWLSGGSGRVSCGLEMVEMIQSSPCLTDLQLWHVKLAPVPGDVSLSIPSLLTLELYDAEIECKLDLPSLRKLAINLSTLPNSQSVQLVFPALTTLVIKDCEKEILPHIRAYVPLKFDISSFSDLELMMVKVMDDMIRPRHPSVRGLRLSTHSISPEPLSDILSMVPDLEDFEFLGSISSPKTFFADLVGHSLTAKTNSANRDPICKSLQRFKLCVPLPLSSSNTKAMMRWFEAAMKIRKKGRHPIKEASYYDGEAWISVL
ncbi:hypothetical protein FRB91_005126 [Serendipita sp. 411]|nr:hypothetical protein FRB91_005126 [Serendipita sp. 411]